MTIALLGGGGHASDVLAVIEALLLVDHDLYPVLVADDQWRNPERFYGRGDVKMVESIQAGARLGPFLASIGYPAGRRAVHDLAVAAGGCSATAIVHPDSTIGSGVAMADGSVVMGQTWISPHVSIGQHTHVSYGVTVGHDSVIGEFASIMPGACLGGELNVGDGVLIGANATVLQGLEIGEGAVVGAGAVVTKDVAPNTTVVGVPAVQRK